MLRIQEQTNKMQKVRSGSGQETLIPDGGLVLMYLLSLSLEVLDVYSVIRPCVTTARVVLWLLGQFSDRGVTEHVSGL